MRNTKETLEKIRLHKGKAKAIRIKIKKLEGKLAVENRTIQDLDVVRKAWVAKVLFKKNVAIMVRRQDLVVAAIRSIGKPITAGPICEKLEDVGVTCHNSAFATMFLPHVMKDNRVVITKVNATKNEYTLREWNGKK